MGLRRRAQAAAYPCEFLLVLLESELTAQPLEAQVDEPGVEHVGLAIAADAEDIPRLPRLPYPTAIETELAWKPEETRHVGERHPVAPVESRQHIHQVGVPPVVAVQVIVIAKCIIAIAHLPETWRVGA